MIAIYKLLGREMVGGLRRDRGMARGCWRWFPCAVIVR